MKTSIITLSILAFTSLPAQSETCESVIAAYKQMPVAVVPVNRPDAGPDANTEQSLDLFAQGYEECQNGQEDQGVLTINQAITLLSGH